MNIERAGGGAHTAFVRPCILGLLAAAGGVSSAAAASPAPSGSGTPALVVLAPDRDNTLYDNPLVELSNGAGEHLFTGLTGSGLQRRCVLDFDVAGSLPAGSTIVSAQLQVHVSKASDTTPRIATLHRLVADWGEGASDAAGEEGAGELSAPGDASWNYACFPSTTWATPGGDFSPAASATTLLAGPGTYTWSSSAGLVGDVQAMLDSPSDDHGWIVVGDEAVPGSAQRLDSRENPVAEFRPRLRIEFVPPGPCASSVKTTEQPRAGSPPNPGALQPGLTSGPRVGALWDPWVDHAAFLPSSLVDVLFLGAAPTNTPSGLGTILCFPALASFTAAPGSPFKVPIPADCVLVGLSVSWQAASADGVAIALTNALDVVLGTY